MADVTAGETKGVTYAPGRYGQGLRVRDTTRVSWPVVIPPQFHTVFWFLPDQVTTSVIWVAAGPGAGSGSGSAPGVSLLVGYDALTGVFFLEDHLYRQVRLAYPLAAGDRLCVGVCQTATERRLFVGKMGGEVLSASAQLAPETGYTTLRLY